MFVLNCWMFSSQNDNNECTHSTSWKSLRTLTFGFLYRCFSVLVWISLPYISLKNKTPTFLSCHFAHLCTHNNRAGLLGELCKVWTVMDIFSLRPLWLPPPVKNGLFTIPFFFHGVLVTKCGFYYDHVFLRILHVGWNKHQRLVNKPFYCPTITSGW